MQKRHRIAALLLSASLLLTTFTGCSGKSSSTSGKKDTLVILSAENFLGKWDPSNHTTLSHLHYEYFTYNRLINMDQTTQKLSPELATKWEYVNSSTLRLTLRQNVKFHDGHTFSAEDAKASIEKYSDAKSVTTCWFAEPIKATVVDNNTVDVQVASGKPYAGLVDSLTMIPMMSADVIKDPTKLATTVDGTGAYKFTGYKNDTMYFEAFDSCWEGAPKVKYVQYKYVPDASTRLAALQTGEADIIERVESEQVPQLQNNKDIQVIKQTTTEVKHLSCKFKVAPMNNEKVRLAISYAIDKESIVKNIFQGYASVAKSFVSPVSWGYADADGLPTYNPEKAKQLLAEAGYPGGKGLPELDIITSVGLYPKTKEYGEFIVSNLKAVGINAVLKPLETAAWNDDYYAPTPSAMIDGGWMPPGLDPDLKLMVFYKSEGRVSHFSDPEVDAVLAKEASEMDSTKRKEILKNEVYPMLAAKMPDIPLVNSIVIFGVSKNVHGFKPLPTASFELKNVTKS